MQTTKSEIQKNTVFEFTLRNKRKLTGKFIKEYPYKGVNYFQLESESGKKYLINPKNAKQI